MFAVDCPVVVSSTFSKVFFENLLVELLPAFNFFMRVILRLSNSEAIFVECFPPDNSWPYYRMDQIMAS